MKDSSDEEVWNYIQTLRFQLKEQGTLIIEMRKEVRDLKEENAYLGREGTSSRTDVGRHLHQTSAMKVERFEKVRELISKLYEEDFDFDDEHWNNGSFDDSFDYGVLWGMQALLFDLTQIVD